MKYDVSDLESLIATKVATLFHDPPHKMWVMFGGIKHEDEAKRFAQLVLGNTKLMELYEKAQKDRKDAVSLADMLASSSDRWALIATGGKVEGVLKYEYLHNIFDPKYRCRLTPPEDILDKAKSVAQKLNRYLWLIENRLSGSQSLSVTQLRVTLYNALYLLLELLWYGEGLPPSLADTRTPTHTIFDHLYASVSVSNMVYEGGVSGYYVVIDFPGIQRFVTGRKAGDLWASSWVLSNVIWRIGYGIAKEFGLDTILMPSPRLNPYSFKGLASTISGEPIYVAKYFDGELGKLREYVSKVYGVNPEELETLGAQPLVPATLTMLLPKLYASSPEEVSSKILEEYRKAWGELYELVVDRLSRGEDVLSKLILGYVKAVQNVLREPPQGLSISVVPLEVVYGEIRKCLEGERGSCESLGIAVDLGKLEELLSGLRNPERVREDILRRLVYHLLVTRGLRLAGTFGHVVRATPRPFWYYKGGRMDAPASVDGEIVCSLCGEEPSAVKFEKGLRTGKRAETVFSDRTIEEIKHGIGAEPSEADLRNIAKYFKPGESLGPYCLFKRSVYHALKDYFKSVSTDDVALMRVARKISNTKSLRERLLREFERVARSRLKESREVFEYLYAYAPMPMKDFEELATAFGMSYDEFTSYVKKTVVEACVSSFKDKEDAKELALHVAELLGLQVVPELREIVDKAVERNLPRVVGKLCGSIAPPTSYAILRGDADDVGKVLTGRLPVPLRGYAGVLKDCLERDSVVIKSADVLEDAKRAYDTFVRIAEALGLEGVLISPAWHSAASLSLMLSAISDYRNVKKLDGLLVYSGGDDVLALLPVHSAIRASLDLREDFTSNYFKKVNDVAVTSSLTTGRSFSVRLTSLKDLMSEEVARAAELLESLGKSVEWTCGSRKDSLVVSDSRSNVAALLPNYADTCAPAGEPAGSACTNVCESAARRPAVHDLAIKLFYALYAGILSENFPRDLAEFVDGQAKHLSADSLEVTVEHVLRRNLMPRLKDLEGKVLEALGRAPYYLRGSVGRERREVVAPLEIYVNLLLILRRYV